MAELDVKKSEQAAAAMDEGTYEVIKERLAGQGSDLRTRLDKLNVVRKDIFGGIETKLMSSERIITENNCVPRDMAPVKDRFIFGYNVHIGLKSKVDVSDVFTIYRYVDGTFQREGLDLIDDPAFYKDFDDLYRYYKDTFFAKITVEGPYLYMVFQTGKNAWDIKVFKWLMEGDTLTYVDARSEHEVTFKGRSDFRFERATRDHQRTGLHPHVSIMDKVFVETIGGDLTIKVEDNTASGKGIYSEPVEDADQSLDDAAISYADMGQLIILKVLPYQEKEERYFIFNNKLKTVHRVDAIKDTCVALPGDQGLIFPKGYYLQNGEFKLFDVPAKDSVLDQVLTAANGEDYQYIFYNPGSGTYLIYTYNIIEQTIDTPIVCSGYAHFDNGEMVVFKHEVDPRQNHMVQIWQTPYVGSDYEVTGQKQSPLSTIGNKDIVTCMADCRGVCKLIAKGESYQSIYVDIVKETEKILDAYFWIGKEEAFDLKAVLKEIKDTAAFAISEYEKVTRIRKATKKQITGVTEETEALMGRLTYGTFDSVDAYVAVLAEIRNLRGKIVSLRDLRYTDLALVDALDAQVKAQNEAFSKTCVDFLVRPEGLKPYEDRVATLAGDIEGVSKSQEGLALAETMDATSADLELLMDIVSNFKIEDPTVTTAIIEHISDLFSHLNNAKAKLKAKVEAFTQGEMTLQFNAQMKLLSQAVVNYMDIADTEDKCDQYLNKVMVQLQELEGKFSESDTHLVMLDEKREEIYNAFESRKQAILDKLNRRLNSLFESSERIMGGIAGRLKGFDSVEAINGYLATDIMAEKVRDIISELRDLGDTVKADEISGQLKALRENTLRQLKDRQDLFVGGENVIKLGKHHFSVNTKTIDLSMVQKEDGLYYHITGTDFWHKVADGGLEKYSYVFNQRLVSENEDVYRGAYLAYSIFTHGGEDGLPTRKELSEMPTPKLMEVLRRYMAARYQEGYTKGVHDMDGTKILEGLLEMHRTIELLIYSGDVRAMARLWWQRLAGKETKTLLKARLGHLAKVHQHFKTLPNLDNYLPHIVAEMGKAYEGLDFFDIENRSEAARYLCRELMASEALSDGVAFAVSSEAKKLYDGFVAYIRDIGAEDDFNQSLKNSHNDVEGQFYLCQQWLEAYWPEGMTTWEGLSTMTEAEKAGLLKEVTVILMDGEGDLGRVIHQPTKMTLTEMVGSHGRIVGGKYELDYTRFMERLGHFSNVVAVDYTAFQERKKAAIARFKEGLHLEDFRPQVLTSFVRNKLIDDVYLPLIGDNLAKQIGSAGDNKRTDLMGLLLLVSPPGYGKTTLMEYIASRLGIILVKVNGPSLGNEVTSLDPAKASHSSAAEELRKLNLALKMGNNVMIYLDDIQHCHPEFLQKFISLCDGQRKIEGVYDGEAQTYDLRGKKVAVVMAGNPYTESGEKFKIPDMLANRADVYNLGDMLRENEAAFRLSYIENSLTSNPVLAKLTNRSQSDLYGMVRLAEGADRETVTFEGSYSVDELKEYTDVLGKLFLVRDVVLKTNMAYIRSAAMADEYRNEPAFKLQGSYRNMNRIAEKVVAVMNEAELDNLILASYENDCQTLTSGAEANLLLWKALNDVINAEESQRLEEIKALFLKSKLVKGDDQMGQAVLALTDLSENIAGIRAVLGRE